MHMELQELAWNMFKKTGDITAYLTLKETEEWKKFLKGSLNETGKIEWISFSRK